MDHVTQPTHSSISSHSPIPSAPSPVPSHTIPIRIHKNTARILKTMLARLNKKSIGKKVRADQVIAKAITLLTDAHLDEIKESTYDSQDRLEIEYRKFCQQNGSISKDAFLKKLLSAALPHVTNPNGL